MTELSLLEFHRELGASFVEVNGMQVVGDYGDVLAEHSALRNSAGVLDLSFRGRLCLTGGDRQRFLNGQVTNNVKDLRPGEGCHAALVTSKGKMQSDLNIFCLAQELLLDFEPGLSDTLTGRFEKYIIADDVQVVDAAPHYGLLSVQGPKAGEVVRLLGLGLALPGRSHDSVAVNDSTLGEIHCMNLSRAGMAGFDLFVPVATLPAAADKLVAAAKSVGGRACGWQALELARVEAGLPRFGADMDESNLPPEAGLEARAISYSKGCYIGQEIIARLRTYGQVTKRLRGLLLPDELPALPAHGDKLFSDGREIGFITTAIASPAFRRNLALGYVRREHNRPDATVCLGERDYPVRIVDLPFAL